jgi:hypothetical protein
MSHRLINCSKKSFWVFISGSDDENFMHDIARFADEIKKKQGGYDKNFMFFANDIGVYKLQGVLKNNLIKTRIFNCREFEKVIKLLNKISGKISFLSCVVSSHGRYLIDHIDNLNMPPDRLMKCLSDVHGLKQSMLLLGQCYSGIYTTKKTSNICVVGASKFGPALCFGNEDGAEKNIFLEYFMDCIHYSEDVDNDGKNTILDCYKYAACRANENLIRYKSDIYKRLDKTKDEIKKLQLNLLQQSEDNAMQLKLAAETKKFDKDMEIYHTYPEFWISDAKLAVNMEIENFISKNVSIPMC